ncbi:hypothetical protein GLOTRDRAFT_113741 [Gloeophyllum trabeum ATCC 11539]|uniref:Uncharacterized protein n=1 Tax=Gloeophyllum trabeum (strain ATCC 11539 / FP-39264 / Madison 617) TaxID=670483 RepID=S7QHZ1_GLOTA|nr:uncharacterized protein GLOTRDRAFT_113741 [Gloeophyllum trabeum ATCC 11539]EPQ58848.1 hypothetical protein GLOTRDRAFT_113741 [Gloeophyllum trabeum ATCC 11539]
MCDLPLRFRRLRKSAFGGDYRCSFRTVDEARDASRPGLISHGLRPIHAPTVTAGEIAYPRCAEGLAFTTNASDVGRPGAQSL